MLVDEPAKIVLEESKIRVLERMLELDEWQALLQALEEMSDSSLPERDEKQRLRFIAAILYLLGLRIHKLQTHIWNAFRKVQGDWWFFVQGKGGKLGQVLVNPSLLEAVVRLSTIPKADRLSRTP